MKQMSLGAAGFERKTKRTRKREFLDEMSLVVPWSELVALIAPTPDPFTFVGLSLPVIAIYEVCIWIVWIIDRRRIREEAGEIRTLD